MPSDRSCCLTRGKSALVPTLFCALTVCLYPCVAHAQDDVAERVKQLTEAMTRVQAQLNESQRQLEDMRQQLAALKGETGKAADPPPPLAAESDASKLAAEVEDLRERQTLQEAQIATQ